MQTASGRDKVCALLQYLVQTFEIYMVNNLEYLAVDMARVKVCHRIVRSISNSRKMLRFLKFIGAIRKFVKYLQEVIESKLRNINLID